PKHLVDSIVAIEDRRFWIHNGIDVRAVVRAAGADIQAGAIVQGGSTITQQVIKNTIVGNDVTLQRKAEEMGLALRLEESLEKTEIFERYANTAFFGENAYGVGAAARRYFAKDVGELTLAESALLAGLLQSPSTLNPYDAPEAAVARRDVVLDQLVSLGWVEPGEANAAALAPLELAPRGAADLMRYPYFTDEVRRRLLDNPALGATPEERAAALSGGGLVIHTTLDPRVQEAAEAAVSSVVPDDGPSGALVALDPRTGHVVALVGGRDFYDETDPIAQFNLATQGRRQAGSAFKPFALAAALEVGVSIDSTWPGGRRAVVDGLHGTWEVANHEDAYYPGLTLHEATVFSVNVPYAYLVDMIGPDRVIDAAAAAGIGSQLEAVPSIVLGTQDVTVLDMAAGYTTFTNGGLHTDAVFVTRIEDGDGNVLHEHLPTFTRVFSAEVAAQVTAALTDAVRRGTGQQAKIGRPVAGKSGTTEGNHDAWFVGYTPEIVAAVWVGFAEGNVPMVAPHTEYSITGGTWPARIWSRFAISALEGVAYSPAEVATGADDLVQVSLDTSTGFLAGPLCPRSHVAQVQLRAAVVPSIVCPIHNPQGVAVRADGTVPEVLLYDLIDAVSYLEASGYEVAIGWDDVADLVPGTIIAQEPEAGTPLPAGSEVHITASGPEPGTSTPDLIGRHRADATERLEALGVSVMVIELEDPTPDPEIGPFEVWAQAPGPGEPIGDTVTIWIDA
ncbi:MAG: transglycosylase domain-containing protein, partial [Acidimicrobiia bacterium]|nr:transglycosylase domain-containing protein [Acidimicrobiia bacterium]